MFCLPSTQACRIELGNAPVPGIFVCRRYKKESDFGVEQLVAYMHTATLYFTTILGVDDEEAVVAGHDELL
jgi:hypothetical protein